jgi:membrane protease YdiL (CAAX protease family)
VLVFAAQAVVHDHVSDLVSLILVAAISVTAYLAGGRWIERRQPTEFRGARGIAEFAGGIALGIVLFSAVMGLFWAVGAYHSTGWGTVAALGTGAVFSLLGAIVEEILFRGFLFRLLAGVAGTWIAVLMTSALFGVAHASNPGASLLSSIAIALEAGVLLGAAYAVTGRLWLPIGLHAGWNFAEGSVFGMSVSGSSAGTALIAGTVKGPTMLTGGGFGPEASVPAVVVCLGVAFLLLWCTARLGRMERPAWGRILPGAETRLDHPAGQ